jgi:phosphatidylinositol alpha-1,6-mannosyltransferase
VDLARAHPLLRGAAAPYAIVIHGWEIRSPLSPGRRSALAGAKLIIANSRTTAEVAAGACPEIRSRTRVAHLGVALDDAPLPPGARAPLALITGRMDAGEREKGHDRILDAWPRVKKAVPEARLLVAGEGNDLQRLQQRARDEHLDGVEFLGFVDDARLGQLKREARLFLFPSTQEGFGLAAVEAAGEGMAVVALKDTVLGEVFVPADDGPTCELVEQGSPAALADSCIALLRDARRAEDLGRRAARLVRERYLERHYAARLLSTVDGALVRPGGDTLRAGDARP